MYKKQTIYIILVAIMALVCGRLFYVRLTKISCDEVGSCQSRFYKNNPVPYCNIFTSLEELQTETYLYEEDSVFESLYFDEYDYVFAHHARVKQFQRLILGDECSSFDSLKVIMPTYDTIKTECTYIYAIRPKGKYRLPCP